MARKVFAIRQPCANVRSKDEVDRTKSQVEIEQIDPYGVKVI